MMSRTRKKFETATTTYVYDGLESILGGYLVGGTQQYASPELFFLVLKVVGIVAVLLVKRAFSPAELA
jgi:hypothetical protein